MLLQSPSQPHEQVFVRKMTPADGLRQMESEINARLQAAGAS